MRKPLIAGNWKMHGTVATVRALIDSIRNEASEFHDIEILVIPTFVHLAQVNALLNEPVSSSSTTENLISTMDDGSPIVEATDIPGTTANVVSTINHANTVGATGGRPSLIKLGAQNVYWGSQGAFTGEVSAMMLADLGCEYVLVGHSERRTLFRESSLDVAKKFQAAIDGGLKPILCVGETKEEREAGKTEAIIAEQLDAVFNLVGFEGLGDSVIAYEPVWAIGTGLTATPEQAQEVHAFIRQKIAQNQVDLAQAIRILYGGSMKADNAAALLAMPDIDGGLIGGASLDAKSFLSICAAANKRGF